jgi:cell division septal protein FtsQ
VAGLVLVACSAAILHAGGVFLAERPVFRVQPSTIQFQGELPEGMMAEARLRVLRELPPGLSLLEARSQRIEDALSADPRMADIRVSLRLPNRVMIRAMERVPEAIIVAGDRNTFVDALGHILRPATPAQLADNDRPFLTGLEPQTVQSGRMVESSMAMMGLQFLRHLRSDHPEFYNRVSEIHVGKDRVSHLEALTIHLTGGTEIRIGPKDPVAMIPEILSVVEKLETEDPGLAGIAYVDLTGKDRAAVMDRLTALALHLGVDVETLLGMAAPSRSAQLGAPPALRALTAAASANASSRAVPSANSQAAARPALRRSAHDLPSPHSAANPAPRTR